MCRRWKERKRKYLSSFACQVLQRAFLCTTNWAAKWHRQCIQTTLLTCSTLLMHFCNWPRILIHVLMLQTLYDCHVQTPDLQLFRNCSSLLQPRFWIKGYKVKHSLRWPNYWQPCQYGANSLFVLICWLAVCLLNISRGTRFIPGGLVCIYVVWPYSQNWGSPIQSRFGFFRYILLLLASIYRSSTSIRDGWWTRPRRSVQTSSSPWPVIQSKWLFLPGSKVVEVRRPSSMEIKN